MMSINIIDFEKKWYDKNFLPEEKLLYCRFLKLVDNHTHQRLTFILFIITFPLYINFLRFFCYKTFRKVLVDLLYSTEVSQKDKRFDLSDGAAVMALTIVFPPKDVGVYLIKKSINSIRFIYFRRKFYKAFHKIVWVL